MKNRYLVLSFAFLTIFLILFSMWFPLETSITAIEGTPSLVYLPRLEVCCTPLPPTPLPPLPDLAYQGYQIQYFGCPWGSPGEIIASLGNIGSSGAGAFVVKIRDQYVSVEGLPAGSWVDTSVSFEKGPLGGMDIRVDFYNDVLESDESNNFYNILFTPPPPCP